MLRLVLLFRSSCPRGRRKQQNWYMSGQIKATLFIIQTNALHNLPLCALLAWFTLGFALEFVLWSRLDALSRKVSGVAPSSWAKQLINREIARETCSNTIFWFTLDGKFLRTHVSQSFPGDYRIRYLPPAFPSRKNEAITITFEWRISSLWSRNRAASAQYRIQALHFVCSLNSDNARF